MVTDPHPDLPSDDPSSSDDFWDAASSDAQADDPTIRGGAAGGITKHQAPAAPVLRQIGGYKIRQVLSSGGMGTVYVAVQDKPRRTVAVKVMKHGIASRSALRRFEYESQILARLKHPYIAQVFEAGPHDDGSGGVPYFAMEYVPNAKTITEYASAKSLGTRERLALIAKVCEAVHHGHTKGIIHRDLKPSNILVDAQGNPKIIDFGVARATDSDLAVTTLQTNIGQLIGTLQYMSPEQCEADPHDIDTRSDVYALGVVLYELLTERLPYDVSRAAIHEAARIIREDPPTRPSTLDKTLRGDVETIVLKALEKERERRYRSAEALADDVDRYLRSEPIQARRPSVGYQLSRFARRHRELVAGMIAVFVLLAASLAVTSVLLVRAVRAETEAREQATRADNEATAANEARVAAEDAQAAAVEEKERADDALKRVLSLSDIKLVDDYAAEADALWPAHPETIADLDTWLTKARALVERLPGHDAELAAVRAGAIPRTPEEAGAERASHPKLPDLETAQACLAWLQRTLAVRAGEAVEPAPEPDWASLPEEAAALVEIARPLVDPERTKFGDEARGLAIARRAAERAPDDAAVLRTLAWALLANGLDDEAGEASLRALDAVPPDQREQYEASLEKLREAVAEYRGAEGLAPLRARIADAEAEVQALDEEVSSRRTWRFANTSTQWQHDVLAELVEGLRAFGAPETGTVADVEDRLAFAAAVEERTTTGADARAAWSAAIASIADRDACPLYDGLVIVPQIGLVPLDRNPETGLWEFWHVQTGARPEPNPAWPDDAPNRWIITGETGLVFVLIPGGTFRMGAEPLQLGVETEETPEGVAVTGVTADALAEGMGVRAGDVLRAVNGTEIETTAAIGDALRTVVSGATVTATVLRDGAEVALTATADRGVDAPNVDADASGDESPVHAVTLDPCFLSKYEMTQGQWKRFAGENPSYYYYEGEKTWADVLHTAAHPVEQVAWEDVDRAMGRLGLLLPTEAQWEYSGRAGTSSIWYTGGQPGTLAGYANIAGQECAPFVSGWVLEEGHGDGFTVHAPVGTFRANAFGLHDVHGNVWEWCRDRYVGYSTAPGPGDGLRDDPGVSNRVYRGGCFNYPAVIARSADRSRLAASHRLNNLGLRPSRVITE